MIGYAVMVAKIAAGEIEEMPSNFVRTHSGAAGAKARAEKLSTGEQLAIAKMAAAGR